MLRTALAAAVAACCFAMSGPARAADAYDNCAGFIDSVPAVITTPGTWCLRKSLTLSSVDAKAIDINADNVTLDCHGYRVTNLGGGANNESSGIYTFLDDNVTIRDCAVRGFQSGILAWGAAVIVEDNRAEGNDTGIYAIEQLEEGVETGTIEIRRNRVSDSHEFGIYTSGAVVVTDNIIDGVEPVDGDTAMGIFAINGATVVARNIVRNLDASASVVGIYGLNSPSLMIRDNIVVAMPGAMAHTGIACNGDGSAAANQVSGWTTAIFNCVSSDNGVTN